LPREDAWRPDATVARGQWRSVFLDWAEACLAYQGSPELIRPAGAWGLGLTVGRFDASFSARLEGERGKRPARIFPMAYDPARLIFAVRLPAKGQGPDGARLLESLKAARVPFQTVRREDGRWSVVGEAFRKRTGLVAVRAATGASDAPLVLALLDAGGLSGWDRGEAVGGEVVGVYEWTTEKCPACKSPGLKRLASESCPLPENLCVGCLVGT